MTNFLNKLWPVLLTIYIISPLDAHPLFLDDLLATGMLIYILFKNSKLKQQQQYNQGQSQSNQSQQNSTTGNQDRMSLNSAYRLLDVTPENSLEEISKAYKEQMSISHPDKVSHLSKQLQEKATELTLELNKAHELIKKSKSG